MTRTRPKDHELIGGGATPTLRRRLRAKISGRMRRGPRSACCAWTGATARGRDGAQRPKIQVGGRGSRHVTVARVLLCLHDRVPLAARDRLEAGHLCGSNHWCVNKWHLAWQTRYENEQHKRFFDALEDLVDDRRLGG